MKRCLYCYAELEDQTTDFHERCSRKIFGTGLPPELAYSEEEMLKLAEEVIKSQASVTGAQPKLSLGIERISKKGEPQRFTIIGLWGDYILKPPTKRYESLPEIEDLTMHLAEISDMKVVPHTLIRLSSGNLSYLTKRVDREDGLKIHMEDMCQLTERLTEQKYNGSYEQIGKAIVRFSLNPGLDLTNFFEQVLFSYLTGNADMHLKNFSLIYSLEIGYILCPAYDLVASKLVVKGDEEDLALTLNGKKRKITKNDFKAAMGRFNINSKAIDNIFSKFSSSIGSWHDFIDISFLSKEMKGRYHDLLNQRLSVMKIR
jgi:serine/threonine-protein kinase HipA